MAALGLNPVMNIMMLPFALVVSVIAATTVFRNVFVRYDAFASDRSKSQAASSDNNRSGFQHGFSNNPRVAFGSRNVRSDSIPLGEYKNHEVGAMSVHRVVDVEVHADDNKYSNTLGKCIYSMLPSPCSIYLAALA